MQQDCSVVADKTVKVSIVLPNYNYARYLHERMTTLLAQTMADYELIVVDDGCTDNSRAVLQKYFEDRRVRGYWYDVNSGSPYARRNDAARAAAGEYLFFAE